VTEALLKNERCFLELNAWQDVSRSMIINSDSITERSEIVVSLMMLMSRLPGIFKDVTDFICNYSDPDQRKIAILAYQAHSLRQKFKKWRSQYDPVLSRLTDVGPGDSLYDKLSKITCFFFGCSIMCNRLIVALYPSVGSEIELESVEYATKILGFEKGARSLGVAPQVSLFLAQRVRVAQATLNTRMEWWETIKTDGAPYENEVRMVERWKFERWCRLFGRQT
jgi:hypothetical protein